MLLCTSSARMNASREQGVDEMFIRRPWSLPCRAASNSFFFSGGYHPNRFFSVSDHRCVNIQKIREKVSISFIFQPFIHERKRRSQELLEGKQPCVSTLEFQVEDGRNGVFDRPDKEGPNNCGRCRVFLMWKRVAFFFPRERRRSRFESPNHRIGFHGQQHLDSGHAFFSCINHTAATMLYCIARADADIRTLCYSTGGIV